MTAQNTQRDERRNEPGDQHVGQRADERGDGRGDERRVVGAVEKGLFVGGRWVEAEGGATFEVVDPSTGEVLCAVADASPADGRAALEAAVAAQPAFARTSPRERADMLTSAYELLLERADELALLMTLEMGKPLAEARGRLSTRRSSSGISRGRRCGSTVGTRRRRPGTRGS